MSRNWLVGTLLLGTVTGCGAGATGDETGNGSGVDASLPFDAGADTAPAFEASSDDAVVPPVADGASDATLDANGVDGGLAQVTPSSLDFGLVNCGSTGTAQTLSIVNPSTSDVGWTATLGQGATSNFQLAPSSGTLTPGQSAEVTVTPNTVPSTASTSSNALGDVVTVSLNSSSATVALTETAQGAVLGFEPTSVGFGSVPLSSGPQSLYFAVQNSGNLAANVTLTLTGDPSFTLPSAATSQTLTATSGSIVDSQITYAPTTATSVSGSVALAVNGTAALCGPLPAALPVSGTGTNGQVAVSPATIVFGTGGLVPCGTAAAAATVTLQNTGSASYTWTGALTHGSSYYTLSAASGSVAAGSSTPLTVTPKPIPATSATTAGEYDDTLTITTNIVGDSPHAVSLQETAQGAIVTRSTSSLNFGNVGVGATITNTTSIAFANTGNVDATLTFANGTPAFVQASPLTIGAGTFASETASFSPTTTTAYTDIGTLVLDTEADGGPVPLCGALPGNLSLAGTGTTPTVTAAPGSLNFGDVPCGQAGTPLMVTITNNGPATNYTASVLKGVGSYFAVAPTSGSLPAGGAVQLTITPQTLPMPGSTAANFYGDTMQLVTGLGNIVDVALNQTALGAILAFSKASIAFGTVASGSSTSSPLTVTNSGTAPATVTLTPSPAATFGVTPSAATTIAASGNNPYSATFSPTTPGLSSGTIALSVSSSTLLCAALPANVTLSGTGN